MTSCVTPKRAKIINTLSPGDLLAMSGSKWCFHCAGDLEKNPVTNIVVGFTSAADVLLLSSKSSSFCEGAAVAYW